MMSELKPCPFCGGAPKKMHTHNQEKMPLIFWCECEAMTDVDYMCIEAWNTRPREDALQARIDELEDHMKRWQENHDSMVRRLDVAMFGEEDAAKQASLCDLISPAERLRAEKVALTAQVAELRGALEDIHSINREEVLADPEYWGNKIVGRAKAALSNTGGEIPPKGVPLHHPRDCPEVNHYMCGCDGAYDDGCVECTEGHSEVYCGNCDWNTPRSKDTLND